MNIKHASPILKTIVLNIIVVISEKVDFPIFECLRIKLSFFQEIIIKIKQNAFVGNLKRLPENIENYIKIASKTLSRNVEKYNTKEEK